MKKIIFDLKNISMKKQRNWSLAGNCFQFVISIPLFMKAVFGEEKIILVPPTIEKSFWVSKSAVSNEYLEEMSLFLSHMFLDVSPSSADFQRSIALKYIDPSYYNILKARLLKEAQTLKKEGISTSFKVSKIRPNKDDLTVEITGTLMSYVGAARVREIQEVYIMKFNYKAGRLLLEEFQEKGKPA